MSIQPDRTNAIKDNLLFILFFNAFFWVLAVIVSMIQLYGQECFERVFPVVVGGTSVAIVAVISAWRQRRIRNSEFGIRNSECRSPSRFNAKAQCPPTRGETADHADRRR